jgi:soluble lytic murein transglycosylase-like protein
MKPKTLITGFTLMLMLVTYAHSQENYKDVRIRSELYEPLIGSAATRYSLDARLLWTIAYLESQFRPEAVSYKDGKPCAYGMMQFVATTARRYGLRNPHNVREAVDAAARYLRDLEKRFDGRRELVLAAYNAGEGTVEAFRDGKTLVLGTGKVINPLGIRTGGIPPYKETREYVARGNFVYQRITLAGLFERQTQGLTDRPNERERNAKTNLKDGSAEDSIYILESLQIKETDEKARSITRKQQAEIARSIYVN